MQNMPAKYIYEPWTAPRAVQEKAGCVIGRDYPGPIVDHAAVLKVNMAKMKTAYAAARPESTGEGPLAKKLKV
jgi:cryptochrome